MRHFNRKIQAGILVIFSIVLMAESGGKGEQNHQMEPKIQHHSVFMAAQQSVYATASMHMVRLLERLEKDAKADEEYGTESVANTESPYPNYSYYLVRRELSYEVSSMKLGIGKTEEFKNIPVIVVCYPNDGEKEDRVNEIIVRECAMTLPRDQEWAKSMEIQITYRSEKYLCYEYVSRGALPEGYDATQLYVTIDLENERWIEYPSGIWQSGSWKIGIVLAGEQAEEEQKEYAKKTVEEQDGLSGETGYQLYREDFECGDIVFSCVQVKGLADEKKQERINEALREPLVALEGVDWSEDTYLKERLKEADIYVAYKTEQWLSVVYSFQRVRYLEDGGYKYYGDGIVDFGVTVDMQAGKRCMLDDLFEIQGLTEWMAIHLGNGDESLRQWRLTRSILPEQELIKERNEGHRSAWSVLYEFCQRETFYLRSGMWVESDSWGDCQIPLQDISQYLKVEPWYD